MVSGLQSLLTIKMLMAITSREFHDGKGIKVVLTNKHADAVKRIKYAYNIKSDAGVIAFLVDVVSTKGRGSAIGFPERSRREAFLPSYDLLNED